MKVGCECTVHGFEGGHVRLEQRLEMGVMQSRHTSSVLCAVLRRAQETG